MADNMTPAETGSSKGEQLRKKAKEFRHAQWIYLLHVLGLLAPGKTIPVYHVFPIKAADLGENWETEDLKLMIEEGRRQFDRQWHHLDVIRGRAQWLFTVTVAVTAALAGALAKTDAGSVEQLVLIAGLAGVIYGTAGAAAIMVVKADFTVIATAVLSHQDPPIDKALAASYSRMLNDGANTVATRLTVLRQAVVFSILGGYVGLVAVLVAA
jgi:acyl dehydratase